MDIQDKMGFKRISVAAFAIYTICIAVLLLNGVSKKHVDHIWQLQAWQLSCLFLIWILIIMPQFILLQYVTNFKTRWAQLTSLILQIIAFVFSLYHHGRMLLLMHVEHQSLETLLYLPIWQCIIILALGLIMKLIQEY